MSWNYYKNGSVAIFDEGWQYPAITEKHASYRMRDEGFEPGFQYIGFPWATLIDHNNRAQKEDVAAWLTNLEAFLGDVSVRRVTVAQHISTYKSIPFFKKLGITDIFWTHATTTNYTIDGIRIHPFPLFPVQIPSIPIEKLLRELKLPREHLYSFIGAYDQRYYISDIRKIIFESFQHPLANIIKRNEWHYDKLVYQKQIGKKELSDDIKRVYDDNSVEYKKILGESTFSLCPSGSGPNSIRLWESLGALSIPVVFSDNLRLPGNQATWERAILRYPDRIDDPGFVIRHMEEISNDPDRLSDMRKACAELWMYYGPQNFIHDLTKLSGGGQ